MKMPSHRFIWRIILTAVCVFVALMLYRENAFVYFSAALAATVLNGFLALYIGIDEIAKKYLTKE